DEGLARMAAAAGEQGLRLMLDLSLDQVAAEAVVRQRNPDWFASGFCGGPPDPRRGPQRLGVAHARFDRTDAAEGLTAWWIERLQRLLRAGVAGFRCLDPQRVPPAVWWRVIGAMRAVQ